MNYINSITDLKRYLSDQYADLDFEVYKEEEGYQSFEELLGESAMRYSEYLHNRGFRYGDDLSSFDLNNEYDIFRFAERDLKARFLDEREKECFAETFYNCWDEEVYGADDTDASEPWGCPWYSDPNYVLAYPYSMEDSAREYFNECSAEILRLKEEELVIE